MTVTLPTKAELRANEFTKQLRERIAHRNANDRYTIAQRTSADEYATGAVVRIFDELTGGSLWVQWYSSVNRPANARFLGGSFTWTLTTKRRRIPRNYRKLWSIVDTFIH